VATAAIAVVSDPAVTPAWQLRGTDLQRSALIDHGGFGVVYRGEHCGQQCAIKCIPCHTLEQQVAFLAEVELMWRMQHPFIVRVIGASIQPYESWIVLELMPGGNMLNYLQTTVKPQQLDNEAWSQRVQWLVDVASAAAYLHSWKVAHCVSC
jgi:serine/threonine protein kinase